MESINTRHESQPINLMMILLIAAALLLALVRTMTMETPVAGAAMPGGDTRAVTLQSGAQRISFSAGEFWVTAEEHTLHVTLRGAGRTSPHSSAGEMLSAGYSELWPGISVVYTTLGGGILHSTYTLAAFADPRQIALAYSAPVEVQANGALAIRLPGGALQESAPSAYQQIAGRRVNISASFSVEQEGDGAVVSFRLGTYDPAYPLVIDPVMDWLDGE
jgi:hypothetical protein